MGWEDRSSWLRPRSASSRSRRPIPRFSSPLAQANKSSGVKKCRIIPLKQKTVTSIGSVFQKINTEAIVALNPDLVLAAEINSPEQVKALEDLKLTVYYLPNPKTFDDLYANLETVGKLTGRSAEAAKLNESLKARYDAVIKKVAAAPETADGLLRDRRDRSDQALHQRPRHFHRPGDRAGGRQEHRRRVEGCVRADQCGRTGEAKPRHHRAGRRPVWRDAESVAQRPGWGALNAVKVSRSLPSTTT